ncbi:protein phosphatase 1K, mitochondrial-like [Mytilus edulis]|uniref:protein phosphatase 1K, mitochondrial-like n=1 Tax=Mytilus edulis TaxID=6550 RepID=UPI0039F0572E
MLSSCCRYFPSICQCSRTICSIKQFSGERDNRFLKHQELNLQHTVKRHYGTPLTDPENKGGQQRGVNFDTLGSWNNRLDMPIMMNESIKRGNLIPEIPFEHVGIDSLLGRRKVNEDRYFMEKISPTLLCFAVFDGHGGSVVSDFVSKVLTDHIKFWLLRETDLCLVLKQAFIDVNNMLARHSYFYSLDTKEFQAGTTATVCLLRDGIELAIGHVGDSRAILCREGLALRLSEDHVPENHREKDRVHQRGGIISHNSQGVWQVNGRLSMTRSLGDIELKKYGVTAHPYLTTKTLKHGKDAFLVLTTDGVNFVLNDQELIDIICCCSTPQEAASFVTDQALHFGSEDNSTAIVIPLGAWGKYRTTLRAIPYSFGRNLVRGRYS